MAITIDTDISWNKSGHAPIYMQQGKIVISKGQIIASGCMTKEDADRFSLVYRAAIGLHADMSTCIKYRKPRIAEKTIELYKDDAHLLHWRSRPLKDGKTEMSWQLSQLRYSFPKSSDEHFFLLDLPFHHLRHKLKFDGESDKEVTISRNGLEFKFVQVEDEKLTLLLPNNYSKESDDDLLLHLSFYFNSFSNVLFQVTTDSVKTGVIAKAPLFRIENDTLSHPELCFINIAGKEEKETILKRNCFEYFFKESLWNTLSEEKKKDLRNAVHTFTRCKFADETTQFLMLYSILDRYVGNTHGKDPYDSMKEKLSERGISIEKIGAKIDVDIQKLKLKLLRSNDKQIGVSHFCNLRNYLMHFMSNYQIDEYLQKSELVSKMRFAVTSILLQEFGFKHFSYYKGWEHLSVMK